MNDDDGMNYNHEMSPEKALHEAECAEKELAGCLKEIDRLKRKLEGVEGEEAKHLQWDIENETDDVQKHLDWIDYCREIARKGEYREQYYVLDGPNWGAQQPASEARVWDNVCAWAEKAIVALVRFERTPRGWCLVRFVAMDAQKQGYSKCPETWVPLHWLLPITHPVIETDSFYCTTYEDFMVVREIRQPRRDG